MLDVNLYTVKNIQHKGHTFVKLECVTQFSALWRSIHILRHQTSLIYDRLK